jgi:hypothetical protein
MNDLKMLPIAGTFPGSGHQTPSTTAIKRYKKNKKIKTLSQLQYQNQNLDRIHAEYSNSL